VRQKALIRFELWFLPCQRKKTSMLSYAKSEPFSCSPRFFPAVLGRSLPNEARGDGRLDSLIL